MKLRLLLFSLLITPHFVSCNLPEPYASIKPMKYLMQSMFNTWCQDELRNIISIHKPRIVVEVGTWTGASAIFMAKLLDSGSKLYTVDTFQGSPEHHKDRNFAILLPTLYQQFLSNCMHEGVAEKIIPMRMSSHEAALALDVKADLIYIDAGHEEEDVYNDILWWNAKKSVNGIICGDDYHFPGVTPAVHRAAKVLGAEVRVNVGFWELIFKK